MPNIYFTVCLAKYLFLFAPNYMIYERVIVGRSLNLSTLFSNLATQVWSGVKQFGSKVGKYM